MIDTYVRLLEAAAETGDAAAADAAVTRIIEHMRGLGQLNQLPLILRELRMIAARRLALASVVEVAHEKDAAVALRGAAEAGIVAKKATVNHTLIRGWRASGNGKLVDHSGKAALVDIYTKITA